MPIESLFSARMKKKFIHNPYYQRNYVWDINKGTYFIESVLLGTEIPPIVVIVTPEGKIEVIDGRQRYETLMIFLENNLTLSTQGLNVLKKLAKDRYEDLNDDIVALFLDTKIRIIEYSIVNESNLSDRQEDLIKKEIFRRYNSGITPLTTLDINRAVYNNDDITNFFKASLKDNKELFDTIVSLFFNQRKTKVVSIDAAMQKIRQYMVLHHVPIKYYSRSGKRQDIVEKLYQVLMSKTESPDKVYDSFIAKVNLLKSIKVMAEARKIYFNRLVFECILWALYVCEKEKIHIPKIKSNPQFFVDLITYINQGLNRFGTDQSHFYKNYEPRYIYTLEFFAKRFNKKWIVDLYKESSNRKETSLPKNDKQDDEISNKINELKELRINKAEPSSTTIVDLTQQMKKRKYLIRPAYQRDEVINIYKSSSIIESILLNIKLPPIFIYKRVNGVNEVIDGQQRLLSILAFIEEKFMNENGQEEKSNKHGFKLKGLKILEEYDKRRFHELPEKMQDKILDFNLSVITIEEERNPNFNPLDLFIRMNYKPYPVRENTFEMWNSYIDKDIITSIKKTASKYSNWFYFRKNNARMVNEEMITSLAYLAYRKSFSNDQDHSSLDIYQRDSKIHFRMQGKNKKDISKQLSEASENEKTKNRFLQSIKAVNSFIKKVKLILVEQDILDMDQDEYLNAQFNALLGNKVGSNKRSLQSFYALWYILESFPQELILLNRQKILSEVQALLMYLKQTSEDFTIEDFKRKINKYFEEYSIDSRKLQLTDQEIYNKIQEQQNLCVICNNSIFFGDHTHNHHIVALAIGGKDDPDNIGIAHASCNLSLGTKYTALRTLKFEIGIYLQRDDDTDALNA